MIFWIPPLPFAGKKSTRKERLPKAQKPKEKDGVRRLFLYKNAQIFLIFGAKKQDKNVNYGSFLILGLRF